MTGIPDYSPVAADYARLRPGYPPALFAHLASLVDRRRLALDGATGNGQAALALADHFERVVAIDLSAEQIRHARCHPRVEYRVGRAESSDLAGASVDLMVAASAIHWFDLEAYWREARRVVRPGGVLAVWSYHVGHVLPPFDTVLGRLYEEVLKPFFSEGARLVDERYETLSLPGEALPSGEFFAEAEYSLEDMTSFIMTWSGAQAYLERQGRSPLEAVEEDLRRLWEDPAVAQAVRWPVYLRASRL